MTTTASRRELFDEKLANCKLYFPDCMCVGVAIHRATKAHNLGVLHTFPGANGLSSTAGGTLDRAGNLCGTTYAGGSTQLGTVYELKLVGSDYPQRSLARCFVTSIG